MSAPVAVAIVSWNSADELPGCLAAVAALDPAASEVVVVDNASADDSAARAEAALGERGQVLRLDSNRGWAGGMNAAIAATEAPWILALNPDARPAPDHLARLLAFASWPQLRVGALTGRLLRPAAPRDAGARRLDACGMRLAPTFRHLDRGSGELDQGQYASPERVFGGTGAALLLARAALDDVALAPGEWIDQRFHSYREDAELCFRLGERGWDVVYVPDAIAEHRRAVVPSGRSRVAPAINRVSLRNRYLLRAGHQSLSNFVLTLPWTLARDLLALGWVLARERGSLGAYGELWRERGAIVARARQIRARRQRSVDGWFWRDARPLPQQPPADAARGPSAQPPSSR